MVLSTVSRNCLIKENYIARGAQPIIRYIHTSGSVLVTENILDSTTIDGSDEETIYDDVNVITDKNVNHIKTLKLNGTNATSIITYSGTGTSYKRPELITSSGDYVSTGTESTSLHYIRDNHGKFDSLFVFDFIRILPKNITIENIIVTVSSSIAFDTTGTLSFTLYQGVGPSAMSFDIKSGSGYSPSTVLTQNIVPSEVNNDSLKLLVDNSLQDTIISSTNASVNFTISVVYRY
jgi:hypothetical protein